MSSYKSGIFTPATRLLQQIPIASKFLLILLVFILPLGYLSWNSVEEKQQQLEFYQTQLHGLENQSRAYALLPRLMLSRDKDYAGEFGFIAPGIESNSDGKEIELTLQQLSNLGSIETQQQLASITRLWQTLPAATQSGLARHDHYTSITLAVRQYLQHLAEDDKLLLGHDLHAFQLSQISVDSMVYAIDLVSTLRGLGAGVISRGNFTPDSFLKLSYYSGELDKTLITLQRAYKASETSLMGNSKLHTTAAQVLNHSRELLATTREQVLEPDIFNISAQGYYLQTTEVMRKLQTLHKQTEQALALRLQSSITTLDWQRNEIMLISGLITLLMLYLFAGFYYAMKQGIQQINVTLDAIAHGDFSQRAEVHGDDEIRQIADNLNHTAEQINKLVKIAYSG